MKQLILYFLFFVCAAFILIQCARYFPSNDKPLKGRSPSGKIDNQLQNKSSTTQRPGTTDARRAQSSIVKPSFNLYFTEQAFPLNMVKYINHYQFLSYRYWSINESKIDTWQLFYNPYTSFTFSGLLDKGNTGLVANNPFEKGK
jgi:hypothetical protein